MESNFWKKSYLGHHLHDFMQRERRIQLLESLRHRHGQLEQQFPMILHVLEILAVVPWRQYRIPDAPTLAPDDPADHVSQAAQQPLLVPFNDELVIIARIVLDPAIQEQIEPHGIDTKAINRKKRIHDVALGLGHLAPVQRPMRVREHLLRQRNVQRHEKSGPVDAMEADNVFADDVAVCRPSRRILLAGDLEGIVGLGDVVDQGVEPDVDGLRLVVRHRDAPGQPLGGPRDGEVVEAGGHGLHDVLHARGRDDEGWVGAVKV